MKKLCDLARKNDGFSLSVVLMVMMVLSILFGSLMLIVQTNIRQISAQDENLRGYYLARSGIDVAYTALMEDVGGSKKIDKFITEAPGTLTDTISLPNATTPLGTVVIEVTQDAEEVKIHAIATLADGSGSKTLALCISKTDFTKTRWIRN